MRQLPHVVILESSITMTAAAAALCVRPACEVRIGARLCDLVQNLEPPRGDILLVAAHAISSNEMHLLLYAFTYVTVIALDFPGRRAVTYARATGPLHTFDDLAHSIDLSILAASTAADAANS